MSRIESQTNREVTQFAEGIRDIMDIQPSTLNPRVSHPGRGIIQRTIEDTVCGGNGAALMVSATVRERKPLGFGIPRVSSFVTSHNTPIAYFQEAMGIFKPGYNY